MKFQDYLRFYIYGFIVIVLAYMCNVPRGTPIGTMSAIIFLVIFGLIVPVMELISMRKYGKDAHYAKLKAFDDSPYSFVVIFLILSFMSSHVPYFWDVNRIDAWVMFFLIIIGYYTIVSPPVDEETSEETNEKDTEDDNESI